MSKVRPIFRRVTHCIFDFDGTLFDTEGIYNELYDQIAKLYGKRLTKEASLKSLGVTTSRLAEIQIRELNLPITVEKYKQHYDEIGKLLLSNVQPMKGAERLLCHLHQHQIPFALATSSDQDEFEYKIKNHMELFDLFSHIVCGGSDPEVRRSKPFPDIFLVAADRFKDKPSYARCLVFEDSPNGVKAACSACMQVVMIPEPETPKEMTTLATQVIKSLNDFQPEAFCLPAF